MVEAAEAEREDTHQLGVVGIFFDVVENMTNPAFEAMFGEHDEHLDNIRWPGKSEHTEVITDLDLTELIPEDIGTAGYYAYGSSVAPNYRVVQDNENTVYSCAEGEATPIEDKENSGDDSGMVGAVIAYAIIVPVLGPTLLGIICCYRAKRRDTSLLKN